MKRPCRPPRSITERSFDSSALACGKTPVPPSGSHHFQNPYDAFTGHLGQGMGTQSSVSPGQAGVGWGLDTSQSYGFIGLCTNWVTFIS
jgi:hypothetical protein